MDKDRLKKDFREIEGAELQDTLKKLGYRSWSDPKLIADFADTFVCNGNLVHAVQNGGRTELSIMIAKTRTKSSE